MFEGVRRGYVLLVLYVMEVIERLGTDPAIELLMEAARRQGEIVAGELRRDLPPGMEPLEVGAEVYRRFMEEAGAEVSAQRRDESSVTFIVRRCPFYEALLDVGVDCGAFLNGLCGNLTLPSIQATLDQFDPRLRAGPVMVRESAEDVCLERVYLEG